ncbi:MAG: hypothetical protein ACR2OM_15240 [Aestuariivirgaceae bacterium]
MTGTQEPAGQASAPNEGVHKFRPTAPHLFKILTGRGDHGSRHRPPAWAQDYYGNDNRRVMRNMAIAGCLVLAGGLGLGVAMLSFKGKNADFEATWVGKVATLWPASDDQNVETEKAAATKNSVTPAPDNSAPDNPNVKVIETVPVPDVVRPSKIPSVKLSVGDVRGAAQSPIPLALAADGGKTEQPIALRLTGLPLDASLSAGSKLEDDAWLVGPAELEGLHLTVPARPKGPLKIMVAAIEANTGKLAAPMQEMTVKVDAPSVVVEPAAKPVTNSQNFSGSVKVAKPAGASAKVAKSAGASEAALAMRTRGDETLALGDVVGARGFYQKALQMGDKVSAGRIGRTYDPIIYQVVGVQGLKPDPKMAERWYRHAIVAGDIDARTDLDRLTKNSLQ